MAAGAVVVAGTVQAPTAAPAAAKVVFSKGHPDAVDVHYEADWCRW
ncbi:MULTISPECIES: hypothetical protein [Micromonospora]|uniref:Uncharacterized protein n=1 Tax=Micromonospora yangpuensis TaxID=683228 RepID=A0A1C6UWQ9_9ACTN|nr:hypothetical protein [Micromonospora yangpuensis]GGM25573.1 hypothetical protein GCM10012279_50020 [Micromonospora yangpuensis]SCL58249.1 hypothetical protein GA0070617_3766 [Micromonospora yangpuensis]